MTSSTTATIDSLAKAGRYLSNLSGSVGFDDALARVEARSDSEVRSRLQDLGRWVRGDSADAPSPELALIGHVARHAARGEAATQAIDAAGTALRDARSLSDEVRSGISEGVGYAAFLLIVAAFISVLWLTTIAREFAVLFQGFQTSLPAYSQFLIGSPWLIFVAIGAIAGALGGLFATMVRLANSIETIAPLDTSWVRVFLGSRALSLHGQWRAVTLANAWAAGGQDPLDAVLEAVGTVGLGPDEADELCAEIRLASELGGARAELEFLARHAVTDYRDALEFRRALVMRAIQVAIGLLVGIIVLAIYLPIFKMGAVV